MNVDPIRDGIVIDHITAGRGMEIFKLLGLDTLDCSVALIKNVSSKKMGKKDIIKIDSDFNIDTDILGYVDPFVTVNVIRDGVRTEKRTIELPKRLVNVLECKNPRCITSVEQELPQIFVLTDKVHRVYRCEYCETQAKRKD